MPMPTLQIARWRRSTAAAIAAALALAADVPGAVPDAAAQQAAPQQEPGVASANYLAPFPENDTWRALVIGDGLAEGLLGGLIDAFNGEALMQFKRKHKAVGSLVRNDVEEEFRNLEEMLAKERVHVAIIMLGLNDRGGIRAQNGKRVSIGSDEWKAQYGGRIDRIVKLLRRRSISVYWVGLPIMRRQDFNDDIEPMNEVYRERAGANGSRYVDVFAPTADENGGFSDRGPDIAGKVTRLRDGDGISFTPAGYRKLAFFLERDIKRDMTTARNERTIPLAGNEAEQKRISPGASASPASAADVAVAAVRGAKDGGRPTVQSARTSPEALAGASQAAPTGTAGGRDQRADNARVAFRVIGAGGREEQVTVDILRPALPQSVIALVTRRDTGDKASQVGETLTDTLSNGLMVMRSITPAADGAVRAPRNAPAQQPFFRALVKGERLPPKPGRADDFRWPREDDLPPPPEAAGTRAGPPISSPVELKTPAKGRGQRS